MKIISSIEFYCKTFFYGLIKFSASCKVYAVTARTTEDANFLKSLTNDDAFDFWSLTRLVGATSTVMVQPERQYWFEKSLSERSIEYDVSISDLERYKKPPQFPIYDNF
mgnify:CR=1 FL=1